MGKNEIGNRRKDYIFAAMTNGKGQFSSSKTDKKIEQKINTMIHKQSSWKFQKVSGSCSWKHQYFQFTCVNGKIQLEERCPGKNDEEMSHEDPDFVEYACEYLKLLPTSNHWDFDDFSSDVYLPESVKQTYDLKLKKQATISIEDIAKHYDRNFGRCPNGTKIPKKFVKGVKTSKVQTMKLYDT